MRCTWCYAKNTGYKSKDIISIGDFEKIVKFCKSGNINDTILIGGEPTLYKDLFYILKRLQEENINTTIVSNGLLFSDIKYVKKIAVFKNVSVDISIKSPTKDSYIRDTGVNCYDFIMKAISNLSVNNIPFSCSMVLTEENIDSFVDAVKSAFENGCTTIGFSFAYDFNTEYIKDEFYLVKKNPFEIIKKFVEKIDLLDDVTNGNWSLENGYPLCAFNDEQLIKLGNHLVSTCQLLSGNGIIFDTDLSIIPCNTMFQLKYGQLGKDFTDFSSFQKYKHSSKYQEDLNFLKSLPDKKCIDCRLLKYCGGGCVCFWTNTNFSDFENMKNKSNISFDVFAKTIK